MNHAVDGLDPQLGRWNEMNSVTTQPPQDAIIFAQFESMRANIHVTHLWLTSTLFEQMLALQRLKENSEVSAYEGQQHWNQREDICRQLLSILYNIKQANLEPNGNNIVSNTLQITVYITHLTFTAE